MKYMISWSERSHGSPIEYENAQKRILEVFTQWKAPDNFEIEMFVIRVGDRGGVHAAGLRRSVGGSQVLLNATCLCIRSAANGACHGRRPGRA
jgi:Protein of unknown function (DUF3303)